MMSKNPNDGDAHDEEGRPDETIEYVEELDVDHWVQVEQGHYDRETDGELATELILLIAEAKGVDPIDQRELPLLYDAIDAQSLEETFFGPSGVGTKRDEAGSVTFMYDGYKVSVRSDGWIFVYEKR